MSWTTELAHTYRLPRATVAEVVAEATRRTLLRSGWCWALLGAGAMAAFGLHLLQAPAAAGGHGAGRFPAIMALVLTMLAWQWRGYRLARPAIHAELARRAARVRPAPSA